MRVRVRVGPCLHFSRHAWTRVRWPRVQLKFQTLTCIAFPPPQILKDATEFFSRATPNLATVIPAMDHIDTHFTNIVMPDSDLNPAICAAVGLGKKTLNRYYSKTDMVEVYRIAMGKYCLFAIENSMT